MGGSDQPLAMVESCGARGRQIKQSIAGLFSWMGYINTVVDSNTHICIGNAKHNTQLLYAYE